MMPSEVAVIGCVLTDPTCADDAVALVPVDDLQAAHHRLIWRAVHEMVAEGMVTDVVALADWMHKAGTLEDAGGFSYLASLLDAVPTSANLAGYARQVRDWALLRRLRAAAEMIVATTETPEGRPALALLESASSAILDLMETTKKAEIVRPADVMAEIRRDLAIRAEKRGVVGIRSGLRLLDWYTSGWEPGRLYTVLARPGEGKSAFGVQVASHAAIVERVPTLIVSAEMTAKQYVARMLAGQAGTSLRDGVPAGWEDDVEAGITRLSGCPLMVYDGAGGTSVAQLRATVRAMVKRDGVGLVVVDYIQRIKSSRRTLREEIMEVTATLAGLARSQNVPIIALAQLRRPPDGSPNRRPTKNDAKESGSIEEDSDGMILLWPQHKPDELNALERWDCLAIVEKMRDGPTGDVPLTFDKASTTFIGRDR
jgi:replicative DNA helicase